jgi:adenine-specific DNA-methyltransferase
MNLDYENKVSSSELLNPAGAKKIKDLSGVDLSKEKINRILFSGNNLEVMQSLVAHHDMSGKVDLVYIDPPFASQNIFRIGKSRTSTISSSESDAVAYSDSLVGAEYLEFIRQRLILIREMMSDTGSIYLHIDYKIGHYVKIIMDEVFGIKNFKNDITRIKCNPKNFSRNGFGNIKDMILFYTKSADFTWRNRERRKR